LDFGGREGGPEYNIALSGELQRKIAAEATAGAGVAADRPDCSEMFDIVLSHCGVWMEFR
jgi:hypothetical protein